MKCDGVKHRPRNKWSRPARGGWIEIRDHSVSVFHVSSRPARGGWIEILGWFFILWVLDVPPRKGRVD